MTALGYRAFGLTVSSEIELPEFVSASPEALPDIRIVDARAEFEKWLLAWQDGGVEPGEFVAHELDGYLLHVPDVGLYNVSGGNLIEVAPKPGADPGMVRLFTVGSAMGMALHQRGILVLHGATIARDGQARIVVGESGAGKSTLAARLSQAGCVILGDDTMAIFDPAGGQGRPWLWQGSQVFKLWQDSIDEMGLASGSLDRIGNRADKFYLPNAGAHGTGREQDGIELVEILVLDEDDEDSAARISPMDGIHALRAVSQNTYRPEYVPILGREAEHFRQCAALARQVPVSRLTRPWGNAHFDETLDLVLSRWRAEPTQSAL